MKRSRLALWATSLLAAVLLPSCGGGGEEEGDNFISVQQFETGGCGFYLMGLGQDLTIRASQIDSSVSKGPTGVPMTPPTDQTITVGQPDGTFATDIDIPEGWTNLGRVGNTSRTLEGTMSCGGAPPCRIRGMVYSVSSDGRIGHLRFVMDESSYTNTIGQALAHFFGCASTADASGYQGNIAGTWSSGNKRILVPTLAGTGFHAWFNFQTGACLIQMQAKNVVEFVATDEHPKYDQEIDCLFSYTAASWRKAY